MVIGDVDEVAGKATADRLGLEGFVPLDVTDPASFAEFLRQSESTAGPLDALVNNAGIMIPKSVVAASDEDLEAILQVNVKAPLQLGRAAWPHLCASGEGRLVTLASLSGKRVKTAESGLYAMSKFAALGLAHAFRHAGFERGVRSTAICPGFVATDMAQALVELDPSAMTQPEDLARIIRLVIELPNTASVAELAVNCGIEASF